MGRSPRTACLVTLAAAGFALALPQDVHARATLRANTASLNSAAATCSEAGFWSAAFGVVGLAITDIATAPASARRYNERRVRIAPMVNPQNGSYGLRVSWSPGRSRPVPAGALRMRMWEQQTVPAPKSPATAAAASFLATAIPMALAFPLGDEAGGWMFLSGLVIGPSVGHFYAGQGGRGFGTAALRGLGTVVGIASIVGCWD